MIEDKFLLFLKCLRGVTATTFRNLSLIYQKDSIIFKKEDDVISWLKSNKSSFPSSSVVDSYTIEDIRNAKEKRSKVEKGLQEKGLGYITIMSKEYPKRFQSKKDTEFLFDSLSNSSPIEKDLPPLLFYKGDISLLNEKKTATIIGTRKPSLSTKNKAEEITKALVDNGYVIVSGIALGCDTFAHSFSLDNKGKTIAILPSGVENITPKENEGLASNILKNDGLLLSEYFPEEKATKYSFVERDRIEALVGDIVIVLETLKDGGTMHAAKKACTYGRKLYVLEPSINNSEGNKILIDEYGAKAITTVGDINC